MTDPIRFALLLFFCIGCGETHAAELGIFDLRPGPKTEHQPAAAGEPAPIAGSNAPPAELTLDMIASSTDFCPGGCVELTAAIGGGRPPYQIKWAQDGAGLSGPGPHRVCPTGPALYEVEVIDSAGAVEILSYRTGCADQPAAAGRAAPPLAPAPSMPPAPSQPNPSAPPTNPPSPGPLALTLEASAATVCRGDCVELTASATGGREPYQYNWELPDLSGPGPHRVCPTKTTSYAAFAMDADFESNHLEVGATAKVTVNDCGK